MAHNALICSLYQIGAIKFGEFTLKSGMTSQIYLDLRQIVSYPQILRSVSNTIWQKVYTRRPDLVCGVPYTALPIATCISLQHEVPMIMRRKEKKAYGTKQTIEGKFHDGQHCLIVEDVITTGGSLIQTAEELESVGLIVKDVAMLIDRQQGGRENLERKNYNVHAAFTLQEVLRFLQHFPVLTTAERNIVNNLL